MNGGVTARPGSMTVAEFIEARLADDEARVKALPPGPWFTVSEPEAPEPWYMMTGHSPARVLRQVTAMRAILGEAQAVRKLQDATGGEHDRYRDWILRHLAAIWSDHEDYDPAGWKP